MTLVNSLLFSKLLFTSGANFRTVASPLLCQRRAFYLWPECTTRSPGTAPPCVTAHRGILEPVIVVVVPILPIRVLSLLHSLVSDQWSPSYYSHNSLPPRVGRVIFLNFQGPTIRLSFMIVKNKENFENNWRNQSILPFWCLMWTVKLSTC